MPHSKYDYWLTESGLALLTGWARDGLSDKQISRFMGISANTLCAWKKKFDQIGNALQSTKDVADYEVENALRNNALSGNTTAQIFWLKNRRPDKWQDKPSDNKPQADAEVDPLTQSIMEEVGNGLLG